MENVPHKTLVISESLFSYETYMKPYKSNYLKKVDINMTPA